MTKLQRKLSPWGDLVYCSQNAESNAFNTDYFIGALPGHKYEKFTFLFHNPGLLGIMW